MKSLDFYFLFIALLSFLFVGGTTSTDKKFPDGTSTLRGNGMQFIENRGQVVDTKKQLRPDVLYTGDGAGVSVYLRKGGVSYVMLYQDPQAEKEEISEKKTRENNSLNFNKEQKTIKLHRVDMDFVDGNPEVVPINSEPVEGYFNYYLGHCKDGITNVKAYNKVVYQNMYKNIDIAYYGGKAHGLKYDIVVKPGGNPEEIKIKYTGAEKLKIRDGRLKIETSIGEIAEYMPKVYQNINGKIVDVEAGYVLNGTTLKFKLGTLNSSFPLIIDPWITYYGGSVDDESAGIATDKIGNAVVTGHTWSQDFPFTPGAFQAAWHGLNNSDAFVVKFDPDGNRFWATYFGGGGDDWGHDIATDSGNNILITGYTSSGDFPNPAAAQPALKGGKDAYAAKLDAGGLLIWSTYYGGTNDDVGYGIAADASNNVVMTGYTKSTDFPLSAPFQLSYAGGSDGDAFLVKFDANGVRSWATYLGGNDTDYGIDITTIDGAGNNIVVTGFTSSPNFPYSSGAFQTVLKGGIGSDIFVIKFDAAGGRLWSTYYGGTADDYGMAIASDTGNNIVITGITGSNNFPCLDAYQPFIPGDQAAFVIKFDTDGRRLWATYLQTTVRTWGFSCSVDAFGNIYILGDWEDDTPGLVLSCGYQKTWGGTDGGTVEDQFITKFAPDGTHLCDTYLGGPGEDELESAKNGGGISQGGAYGGGGIACYGSFIYVTTNTFGHDFPVTAGAFQTNFTGVEGPNHKNMIIGRLCGFNCGDTATNSNFSPTQNTICSGQSVDFNVTGNLVCDTIAADYFWSFSGGVPATSTAKNPSGIIYADFGTFPAKLVMVTPCGKDSAIKNINVLETGVSISGTTSLCPDSSTVLKISGANTVSWSPATGLSSVNSSTVTATVTSTISYTVTGIGTSGCAYKIPVTLTVSALPVISGNDTTICEGQQITLTVLGGTSYLWSTGGSTSSIIVNPNTTTAYTVTTANGPCILSAIINVTVIPLPVADAGENITIVEGDTTVLSGSGTGSYLWTPSAGLSCTTCANPTANPQTTTTYFLVITDANGCTDMDFVIVTVDTLAIPCGELFVPNAFSPNGDGYNDEYKLQGSCIREIEFTIFNRWGETVFKTNNINKIWDGSLDGKPLSTGIFVYQLKATLLSSKEVIQKGNISLIK